MKHVRIQIVMIEYEDETEVRRETISAESDGVFNIDRCKPSRSLAEVMESINDCGKAVVFDMTREISKVERTGLGEGIGI